MEKQDSDLYVQVVGRGYDIGWLTADVTEFEPKKEKVYEDH